MNVTRDVLDSLCRIAEAAGREAMAVYHSDFAVRQKDDASPLTEADLRADKVIRTELERTFPGMFILSEESSSLAATELDQDTTGTFFLVDPLDGTKEFVKRNGEFTVNIALIQQGKPVAGVVLAPALDELFYAAEGLGAWKRTSTCIISLKVAPFGGGRSLHIIGSRSHGSEALNQWLAKLNYEYTFIAAGSALKFCRIAEALADLYPRFGPTSQWDTAAAQCVLEQAGGAVCDFSGASLRYGLDRPILNPYFFAAGDPSLLVYLPVS